MKNMMTYAAVAAAAVVAAIYQVTGALWPVVPVSLALGVVYAVKRILDKDG